MNIGDLLYHLMTHFGIGLLMVPIIAFIAYRTGQLSQADKAAALPLIVGGIEPDDTPTPRRFPVVALVMAVILGIGIGVPVATTLVASRIADPGAAITATEDLGH